jgi:purine-binding chemotaxis protein CheW
VRIVLDITNRVIGMVIDSVSDVVRLSGKPTRAGAGDPGTVERQFLAGIATLDDRALIL